MLREVSAATNAGGWQIVAHSDRAVLIRVTCRDEWVGTATVYHTKNGVQLTSVFAKPTEREQFATSKHRSGSLAEWVYRTILELFSARQVGWSSPLLLRWPASEHDLTNVPITLAAVKTNSRIQNVSRVFNGYWRFILGPDLIIVVVRVVRDTVTLVIHDKVLTRRHGGIYDSSIDPSWHLEPDTSAVQHWLFTCTSRLIEDRRRPSLPRPRS